MNTQPIRCPLCRAPLVQLGTALRCPAGHSFDLAKEGYANLLPVNAKHALNPGDDKAMVQARREFLAAGFYAPFARELARLCGLEKPAARPLRVLDAGCGEGYYGRVLLEALPDTHLVGYDIAKPAVRLAAKAEPRADYLVASSNAIPVADGWADVVLNVFSPMAAEEFARVLRPGGCLLYAVPGPRHLWGMKEVLYEKPYENPVRTTPYPGFRLEGRTEVSAVIEPQGRQLQSLFAMTPYYWKTPRDGAQRLAALPGLTTEISFAFLCYRREPNG